MAGDVGLSDDAVRDKTGKTWAQWEAVLDRFAADLGHTQRARRLSETHPDLSGWWVQMVTVEYERRRGLREVGQTSTGDYQVSRSKTIPLDPADALQAARQIIPGDWTPGAVWQHGDARVEVRRADDRMLRCFWDDGHASTVEISLEAKGPGKTTIAIRHHRLKDDAARQHYAAHWAAALQAAFG